MLRLLVDMNLSPEWADYLTMEGFNTVHWSEVGSPRADDSQLLAWACSNSHVVFTHDLDFGALLALTHADGPSVLQVRGQDVLPENIGPLVVAALRQHEEELVSGALLSVNSTTCRVRILPL